MHSPEFLPSNQSPQPDDTARSVIDGLIDRANKLAGNRGAEELPLARLLPLAMPPNQTTSALIERFKARRAQSKQSTEELPN